MIFSSQRRLFKYNSFDKHHGKFLRSGSYISLIHISSKWGSSVWEWWHILNSIVNDSRCVMKVKTYVVIFNWNKSQIEYEANKTWYWNSLKFSILVNVTNLILSKLHMYGVSNTALLHDEHILEGFEMRDTRHLRKLPVTWWFLHRLLQFPLPVILG